MEEEEARRDLAESPLLAHLVVLKMEDVMDKLKLLDYEKLFCKSLKFRPLPRYYIISILLFIYIYIYSKFPDIILPFVQTLENSFTCSLI